MASHGLIFYLRIPYVFLEVRLAQSKMSMNLKLHLCTLLVHNNYYNSILDRESLSTTVPIKSHKIALWQWMMRMSVNHIE